MTCQEIGQYIENQNKREKDKLKIESMMGYKLCQMLISANGMCVKKPKIFKFEELFPEQEAPLEEQIENEWRKFLGVVR